MQTTTAAPTRLERGRVGESVPRSDGIPKTTGEFAYASDLQAAGMLWGHTLRSPTPHARIVELDVGPALALPGLAASVGYLGGYGVGTVAGMTLFAGAIGWLAAHARIRHIDAPRWLLSASSALALVIGAAWLVS